MKVTPRDSQRLSSQRPGGLGKEQRRQTELFHIGHLTLALLLGRDIQYLPAQAWESRVAGGSCQALGGRLGGESLVGTGLLFFGNALQGRSDRQNLFKLCSLPSRNHGHGETVGLKHFGPESLGVRIFWGSSFECPDKNP